MTNDEKKLVQREKDRKVRDLKLAELQELAQVIMENDEFEEPVKKAAQEVFEWCENNDWAEVPAIEMQKDELLNVAGAGEECEEAPC
ncbi:hypothetical protein DIPPA_27294 [Diplonema papillatum]|nr:hypothetical protein DIPPA_27294 [Diplonema papillatum]